MSEQAGGERYFYGSLPVFRVEDVLATATYYRDILGFEIDFVYGEPPTYASVSRDEAILNFTQARPPDWRDGGRGYDVLVVVRGLEMVFDELRQRGANILREPLTQPHGMRDFLVEDCNHYRIAIAEEVEDEA